MVRYFIVVMRNYAVFSGRARRSEYWYFILACLIIGIVISIIAGIVAGIIGMKAREAERFIDIVSTCAQLVFLVPSIAVAIRRMHDVDKSGWYMLIPLYNLYLSVQPGTSGPNRFGPDPKAAPEMASLPSDTVTPSTAANNE